MSRTRHLSGPLRVGLVLVAWSGVPLHARGAARWIELRSPHFTLVSNAREEKARRVALELEGVRELLQHAHTGARFESREPVVVLAVSDENALRELLPQFWERKGQRPVAAFWRGPYRQCIALRVDAPEHERHRRVLHEYVHLLTHANVPDLPVWLDEGVSEFWDTAIAHDNAVEVGRPASQDLRLLQTHHPWIPLEELLAMERVPDGRDKQKLSLFYAQSWALVHYLMLGGPSVNLALAPATDFASVPQLESAVAAYVSGGRFRTVRIEAPTTVKAEDQMESNEFRVRTLPPATSLAVRAGCLAEGERTAAALPLLARAVAENSTDPSVFETMGYVHFQQNDPVEAAQWFDRAIASGSASHLAYFYRAILAGPVPDQAPGGQPVVAADYLRRAIDLAPGFVPAYGRLAGLFAEQEGRPIDALPLLRKATDLEPDNPLCWIDLGRLLVTLDRPDEAREAGAKGLAAARSVSSRRLVEAFIRDLPE